MNKHFVLTHGRSGSNFLVNSLNLHPQLLNYGEVLGHWTAPDQWFRRVSGLSVSRERRLDWMLGSRAPFYAAQVYAAPARWRERRRISIKRWSQVHSVGVKDFVFLLDKHLLHDYLVHRSDVRVIYLHRPNLLQRYVSLQTMSKTGLVKTEASVMNEFRMVVDIDDLLMKLSVLDAEEKLGESLVSRIPPERILSLDYDEYFGGPGGPVSGNRQVFDFLGVASLDVSSGHRKIVSTPLEQLIVNFDSVREALRKTCYERYLPC